MSVTALLLLMSTCLYAGFQWTIRVLVYPQFAEVPVEAFTAFERRHQQRVTAAVGPLFVFAGAAAIAAFVARPGWLTAAAGACVGAGLVLTGLLAVPAHRRLSEGFDAAAYRRLLRIDTLRLVLAVLAVAAAAAHAA